MHYLRPNKELPLLNPQTQNFICDLCFNSGLARSGQKIIFCPVGCSVHFSPATSMLDRALIRHIAADKPVDFNAFDIARILTRFSSEKPCKRRLLEELFFDIPLKDKYADSERQIKGYIETLRHDWLLPIGSRKSDPCGYWIITNLEDFKAWFKQVTSAPITQLSTIHRVAKHNFPVFAEQIELDFWRDFSPEEVKDAA